jgi:hypothetical protein
MKLGKIEWKKHLGIPEPFYIDLGSNGIGAFGIGGMATDGYRVRLTKN